MTKPGWKTSEFYLVLVAILGAVWKQEFWLMMGAMVLILIYILSRSWSKKEVVKNITYNK